MQVLTLEARVSRCTLWDRITSLLGHFRIPESLLDASMSRNIPQSDAAKCRSWSHWRFGLRAKGASMSVFMCRRVHGGSPRPTSIFSEKNFSNVAKVAWLSDDMTLGVSWYTPSIHATWRGRFCTVLPSTQFFWECPCRNEGAGVGFLPAKPRINAQGKEGDSMPFLRPRDPHTTPTKSTINIASAKLGSVRTLSFS